MIVDILRRVNALRFLTWYMEQLKQCQQQLSPSTYFFAWPFSQSSEHTDSGGFGWWDLNWTSTFRCAFRWMHALQIYFQSANYELLQLFRCICMWKKWKKKITLLIRSVIRIFALTDMFLEWWIHFRYNNSYSIMHKYCIVNVYKVKKTVLTFEICR